MHIKINKIIYYLKKNNKIKIKKKLSLYYLLKS